MLTPWYDRELSQFRLPLQVLGIRLTGFEAFASMPAHATAGIPSRAQFRHQQKRVSRRLQYTAGVPLRWKMPRPSSAKSLRWYHKDRNVYVGGCSTHQALDGKCLRLYDTGRNVYTCRRLQYTGVRCKMPRPSGAKGLRWWIQIRVCRRLQYTGGVRCKVQKDLDCIIQTETCMQAAAVHRCEMQKCPDPLVQKTDGVIGTCTQAAAIHSRCQIENARDGIIMQNRLRRRLQYTAGVRWKMPEMG
ncbi:hypothetical protein BaRGS_00023867 [Batillaria attramentaria]|uniref:Uncharacterized protein n=1 Tax=Batillaria attramentaria TaxID=370345 RepID=A0ABD0KCE8_9CAEN